MTTRSIRFFALVLLGAPTSAQWSAFHGDAQRSGTSSAVAPLAPHLAWAVDLGGPIACSPVLAPDGTIVLGAVLKDDLHPHQDIIAVRPDGTIRWRYRTRFVDLLSLSSPAIAADGTIYVVARDGFLYALSAGGQLKWERGPGVAFDQHVVVVPDGTVYIRNDGRLAAFDPAGSLLWQSTEEDLHLPGGSSLAQDGTICISAGSYPYSAALRAYGPTGQQLWSVPILPPWSLSSAPPTVGQDGTIYIEAQEVHAIDPAGFVRWKAKAHGGSQPKSSLSIDLDGNIYSLGLSSVVKLDPAGNFIWSHPLGQGLYFPGSAGSPLVDRVGRVYLGLGMDRYIVSQRDQRFLALRPDGSFLWEYQLPGLVGASSPAMGSDGTLYFGCTDGTLYALRPLRAQWPRVRCAPRAASPITISYCRTALWSNSSDGKRSSTTPTRNRRMASVAVRRSRR